jgi:predicted dehydrogenase
VPGGRPADRAESPRLDPVGAVLRPACRTSIAALCDVDETILRKRREEVGGSAQTFADVRRLLDDPRIDAISIATPNHWHALIAIWACQAGKDVYVEKPCSHNLCEGRQLVRAAQKYQRIVQHGTQSRSAPAMIEAIKHVRSGTFGGVYLARGPCFMCLVDRCTNVFPGPTKGPGVSAELAVHVGDISAHTKRTDLAASCAARNPVD